MAEDRYHVIVTGATGGLGEAIVQSLLKSERKHRVVGTTRSLGNHKVAELQAWAAELGASERLSFVELDYGSTESVNKGIEAARLQLGGVVDVVVNNAGVAYTGIVETFTAEQYLEQLNINVVGPHRVTKAILPSLRSRGSGAIINISSILGRKVIPFWGVYTSSKFALESQSEALRLELNPVGVQVLVVEPGGIATPIHEATIAGADQHVLQGPGYPAFAEQRAAFNSTFRHAVATSTTATPDAVGEALRNLIETPPADRPFRTVVDPLFGGEDVIKLNQVTEEILAANLTSFHSSNLLVLAKPQV